LTGDPNADKIFTGLEIEPSFFGGHRELVKFLNEEKDSVFLIDLLSSNKNSEDSVELKFIVRREGGIGNLSAIFFSNDKLKNESIRLLKKSCVYWVPGMNGSRNLNAWHVQKIIFRVINDNSKVSVLVIPAFNTDRTWIEEN